MAKFKHPQILIANHLLDGEVLFMGKEGWLRDHRHAVVATSDEAAEALLAQGKAELAANRVIDAYLVDIAMSADGHPEPIHYREKMRTRGPTVRLDLGKQAVGTEFGDI
jgi:Protein of unknown function (DUF2849)